MEKCRGRVEEPELSYNYEETFVNTVSSYKCELTDIVTRIHQTSANQSKTKCQHREGSWTHNLTPNCAAIGNF